MFDIFILSDLPIIFLPSLLLQEQGLLALTATISINSTTLQINSFSYTDIFNACDLSLYSLQFVQCALISKLIKCPVAHLYRSTDSLRVNECDNTYELEATSSHTIFLVADRKL